MDPHINIIKSTVKTFFLFYFYFIKVFYWCYECVAYIQLYCRLLIILIGIELPSIWADMNTMNSRVAHFQLASRTTADHRLRTPATRAKSYSILCCFMHNVVNSNIYVFLCSFLLLINYENSDGFLSFSSSFAFVCGFLFLLLSILLQMIFWLWLHPPLERVRRLGTLRAD